MPSIDLSISKAKMHRTVPLLVIMSNVNGSEKWHKVIYIDNNSTYECI